MKPARWIAGVVTVWLILPGCGGKDAKEAGVEQRAGTSASGGPAEVGPRRVFTAAELDTLRARKARYGINRDQYWRDRGGVLGSDYIEVWYPAGEVTVTHAMRVFDEMVPARRKFEKTFGRAPGDLLVIRIARDLDDYKAKVNREWWHYSEIRDDTLTFQPVWILVRRGLAHTAIPHEYYQWAVGKVSRLGAPRWLEEGIASHLSDEADLLTRQLDEFASSREPMSPEKIEGILDGEEQREPTRIAYYRAYRMVKKLADTYGESKLYEWVFEMGRVQSVDQASKKVFQKSYDDVLRIASDYTIER